MFIVMGRRAIGIDLGTTNCALAWLDQGDAQPFPIPQFVERGEVASRFLLPSFVYLPAPGEWTDAQTRLPWDATLGSADRDSAAPNPGLSLGLIVGELARKLGSKVPGRLVSSAKSWLCHPGVDRRAKILPWQSTADVEPISPVDASALFLKHLADAWNSAHPDAPLEAQHVALTIPASFDEVARELTVEAAAQAGLAKVILLEEPQAAFYQWLEAGEHEPLEVGTTCVVIDCGGGTTDFSLLAVEEEQGGRAYRRIAVGDHLLLGGDNIDIAIARHIEEKLSPGRRLDLGQWWHLILDARRIKETMLADDAPDKLPVAILGRGRKIIGDVAHGEVTREEMRLLAIDGFFPKTTIDEFPDTRGRMGLQEFGLPYVNDPAITKHLASFLARHADQIKEASPAKDPRPGAVLFNGGLFNAGRCRDRVLEVLSSWYGGDWRPRVLETSSLDLAVAQGAARYAHRRATGGKRIHAGASRSYYIGLASADQDRKRVLCVVPQGLQEETPVKIDQIPLELQIGEPVSFPLWTSTARPRDQSGELLEVSAGQLAELPSLTTLLRGGKRSGRKRVAVHLEAKLTEIGTLELFCATADGNNRWRLQFQTRSSPRLAETSDSLETEIPSLTETWSEEQIDLARVEMQKVYGEHLNVAGRTAIQLPKYLETALSLKRDQWPTSLLRPLAESLLELTPGRGKTPEHEGRWYNLVGFTLRPGLGDPLDPFRVERLWKIVHAGALAQKSDSVWTELWIMLRRVAGGLDPVRQLELSKRLTPYVLTTGNKRPPRRVGSHELAEIWRTLASLEHLPPTLKVELGRRLLGELTDSPLPTYVLWSLARLGLREPLYGPANVVVAVDEVERWLEELLRVASTLPPNDLHFTFLQLARLSGDRGRDVDLELRQRVHEVMEKGNAKPDWTQALKHISRSGRAEQTRLLGDALPTGLRVATDAG